MRGKYCLESSHKHRSIVFVRVGSNSLRTETRCLRLVESSTRVLVRQVDALCAHIVHPSLEGVPPSLQAGQQPIQLALR